MAARAGGAGAVAVLGQFAVDMPGGYLGSFDEITPFGAGFALLVTGAVAVAVGARWRGSSWAGPLAFIAPAASVTVFLPAAASDPVLAGTVVLWQLLVLGQLLSPVTGVRSRAPTEPLDRWLMENRTAVQHLLALGTALTITVVGFEIGHRIPAQGVCLLVAAVGIGAAARFVRLSWARGSRSVLIAAAPLVAAALSLPRLDRALAWIGACQAALLVVLLARSAVVEDLLESLSRRSALLIAVSFAVLILVGTLFLSFPAAAAQRPISPIDALFTATSAVCVTGLIVVDTPTAFSAFGHGVLLLLIQFGGLNIMVLSAFAALVLGRRLGLKGERALGESLGLPASRTAIRLAAFIVATTVAIEAAGTLLMTLAYDRHGFEWGKALWYGFFHSVSAFCNAGFALHSDNLMLFRHDPWALLVMGALVALGGVGFAVLASAGRLLARRGSRRLSAHVKLVLAVTGVLTVAGTAFFLAVEWNSSLADLGVVDKLTNALFQAITPRTAGFNSVDLGRLHAASVLVFMVLMFVGASPGGTGGGIKTTTAAVLLGSIAAIARGASRVEMFRRAAPLEIVHRSAAIAVSYVLAIFLAALVLLLTQPLPAGAVLFEVVSALGTVGLSLGVTSQLDGLGKMVIVVLMFVGRIGPLALALSLASGRAGRLRYPDARIMVG